MAWMLEPGDEAVRAVETVAIACHCDIGTHETAVRIEQQASSLPPDLHYARRARTTTAFAATSIPCSSRNSRALARSPWLRYNSRAVRRMGVEGRDWYREDARDGRGSRQLSRLEIGVLALVVVALVTAVSPPVRERLGYELPFGLENLLRKDATPGALRIEPLPGLAGVTLREQPLYASDDPWSAWLADEATCPGGEDRSTTRAAQARTMLCLVNFARAQEGLAPLELSGLLSATALVKASDIVRCGAFEHEACGQPFDEKARQLGYDGSFGENLYMAEGPLVVPRVALDQWLNSDGHRENLFRREWRTIGIGLLQGADVEQVRNGVVWVQHFGTT
jgi:uncharacterized protein YkwD